MEIGYENKRNEKCKKRVFGLFHHSSFAIVAKHFGTSFRKVLQSFAEKKFINSHKPDMDLAAGFWYPCFPDSTT